MNDAARQSFKGKKAAILVANGFREQDVTLTQRALQNVGATTRIVSMEDHGLANSWNGSGWGLHFAADAVLKSALAVDYSMLVVPGGQRSVEKLRLTAHTRRFIAGFADSGKPVAVFDNAIELLIFSGLVEGRTITGRKELESMIAENGGTWTDRKHSVDGNLITGQTISDENRERLVEMMVEHAAGVFGASSITDIPRAA